MQRMNRRELSKLLDRGVVRRVYGKVGTSFVALFFSFMINGMATVLLYYYYTIDAMASLILLVASCVLYLGGAAVLAVAVVKLCDMLKLKLVFLHTEVVFRDGNEFVLLEQGELDDFKVAAQIVRYHSDSATQRVPINSGTITLTVKEEQYKIKCSDLERCGYFLAAFMMGRRLEYAEKDYKPSPTNSMFKGALAGATCGIAITAIIVVASMIDPMLGGILGGALFVFMSVGVLILILRWSIGMQKQAEQEHNLKLSSLQALPECSLPSKAREEILRDYIARVRKDMLSFILPLVVASSFIAGGITLIYFYGAGALFFSGFVFLIGGLFYYGFIDLLITLLRVKSCAGGEDGTGRFVASKKLYMGKCNLTIEFTNARGDTVRAKTPYIYTETQAQAAAASQTFDVKVKNNSVIAILPH